jgi:hypothetical protein
MATRLERILDSLENLNSRIDRLQEREAARRADSEARAAEIEERRRYRRQQENQVSMSDLQSRADDALGVWNVRAPSPSADDTRRSYRLRLLSLASRRLPPGDELRRVDLRLLGNDAIDIFEPKIFAACKDAVHRVDTLAVGEMREIRDKRLGSDISTFVGERSFVVDMQANNRRVTQFAKRDGSFREE